MTVEEMEKLVLEEHNLGEMDKLSLEEYVLEERIPQLEKENKRQKRKNALKRTKAFLKLTSLISCIPLFPVLLEHSVEKITGESIWLEEIPALITEEIDSDGNITEEKVYSEKKVKSHLTYYTYWKDNKTGYFREVYTYDLSLTESDKLLITNMINNEESLSIKTIKNVMKEIGTEKITESKRKEYKLEISKNELNKGDYIEATITTTNKLDKIKIPSSTMEKVGYNLITIVILIFAFIVLLAVDEETKRKILNTFLNKQIEDIKSKPNLKNIESLKKRLQEIKELLNNPDVLLDDLGSAFQILETPEQLNQPEKKVLKKEPEKMKQQG